MSEIDIQTNYVFHMLKEYVSSLSYNLEGYDDTYIYFTCGCQTLYKLEIEKLYRLIKPKCCDIRKKSIEKEIKFMYKSVDRLFKCI